MIPSMDCLTCLVRHAGLHGSGVTGWNPMKPEGGVPREAVLD
jgi:hypothetical protein